MADTDGLDAHHRDTLIRIYAHPMPHNLKWHDVESLLRRVGRVTERAGERLAVTVGRRTVVFAERRRDVVAADVAHLRRLLTDAGWGPVAG